MLVSGVVDADISPKPTLNQWWASRTRVPPPEKGIVGFQDVRFFTPTNARHATSRYWYPGMHRGHRGHRCQRGVRVVGGKKKKKKTLELLTESTAPRLRHVRMMMIGTTCTF